ncbi:MAG: tryptophan synthase subunit alpha [Rhodoblastus sp.]
MTTINPRFATLAAADRAALVTFRWAAIQTATSLEIIKALPKAKADVIEIRMPLHRPMADGPRSSSGPARAAQASA